MRLQPWLGLASLSLVAIVSACTDRTVQRTALAPTEETPDASTIETPEDASTAEEDSSTAPRNCVSVFGRALTPELGRLDGVVRDVVLPHDPECKSDDNHVFVQVDVEEEGKTVTYPAVVNVESDLQPNDPNVRFLATKHVTFGSWSSGWHTGTPLDYAVSLDVHSNGAFVSLSRKEIGDAIVDAIPKGAKVSIYMHGFDSRDGGHKIHRNSGGEDGAIVVLDSSPPTWLLFHFAQQVF